MAKAASGARRPDATDAEAIYRSLFGSGHTEIAGLLREKVRPAALVRPAAV